MEAGPDIEKSRAPRLERFRAVAGPIVEHLRGSPIVLGGAFIDRTLQQAQPLSLDNLPPEVTLIGGVVLGALALAQISSMARSWFFMRRAGPPVNKPKGFMPSPSDKSPQPTQPIYVDPIARQNRPNISGPQREIRQQEQRRGRRD